MRRLRALAPLLAALVALTGCGLHPLYGDGGGASIGAALERVEVSPIQGKSGWLMANALRDRLGAGGSRGDGAPALYRLHVTLDDQIAGLGIRPDNSVSRERRTLRSRFQLVDAATGAVVLDATAGSDAGIDVVGSEYATIAAENSAQERLTGIVADRIVARLALYTRRSAATK